MSHEPSHSCTDYWVVWVVVVVATGGATVTAAGWLVVLSVVVLEGAGVGLLLMHPDRANTPLASKSPSTRRMEAPLLIISVLLVVQGYIFIETKCLSRCGSAIWFVVPVA